MYRVALCTDIVRRVLRALQYPYWTCRAKLGFWLNSSTYGSGLKVFGPLIIHVHRSGNLRLGNNCKINSGYALNRVGGEQKMVLQLLPNASVAIGHSVSMSSSTIIAGEAIEIKDGVFIGGGCHIYDTDFHSLSASERISKTEEKIRTAKIIIGAYAFIGAHSIIVRGVTIGDYSIVAAGSVVSRSIPSKELWGGAPARFIRKLSELECATPQLVKDD